MKNSAILVLGYNEPSVLSRSVQIYRKIGFDVFVHVDNKMDIDIYKSQMEPFAADQCVFIEDRHNIYWAGFSMVEATISLMKNAMARNEYGNFILLSDDTMPIRPIKEIEIMSNQERNRINMRGVSQGDKFYERYKNFYYFDSSATTLRRGAIESNNIDDCFLDVTERIKKRKKNGKVKIEFYTGSQWWMLSRHSVEKILDSFDRDADLRESFEFTAVPDESYFHTIIGNSDHFDKPLPSPVLTDWSRSIKPHIFGDGDEINLLRTEHHFFLRKVTGKSPRFLDMIESMVLS